LFVGKKHESGYRETQDGFNQDVVVSIDLTEKNTWRKDFTVGWKHFG
jgi:hypothetical protein